MKRIVLFLALLVFSLKLVSQTPLNTAVQFEAKDFNGIPHDLFGYLNDGKYVLLSFYTMNCGSCNTYSPHISDIYEGFGCNNGNLIVLGVNWGATNAQLQNYHQQHGWVFPALSGFEGYGNEINSSYEIQSFISVILIAPGGEIINQYIYPPTYQQISNMLQANGLEPSGCTVGTENLPITDRDRLIVYPNPATSWFKISSETIKGDYNLALFDLNGRKIIDFGGLLLPDYASFQLNGIKPGIYMLKAWSHEKKVLSGRLTVLP